MDLLTKCTAYINTLRSLFEKGVFTLESWEPVYDLEDDIRKYFGLPASFRISSFLQKTANRKGTIETVVYGFIEDVQMYAAGFLSETPQTDRQILEAGKAGREAFDNVLPYMDICPHTYCVFIYEELYCRDTISTDEALAAFRAFSKKENEISNLIRFKDDCVIKINFDIYRALCSQFIPYLDNYLQYQIDIHTRHPADKKDWANLFRRSSQLSRRMSIDHFFVTKIQCFQHQPICFLNIIFQQCKQRWYGLILQCLGHDLEKILDHSRYNNHASLIRANLSENVSELDLRDFCMNQLEITGLIIGLERVDEVNYGYYDLLFVYDNLEINSDQLPF